MWIRLLVVSKFLFALPAAVRVDDEIDRHPAHAYPVADFIV